MKAVSIVCAVGLVAVWLLAVASIRAGNPTAINAVVGIPAGLVFASPLLYLAWRFARETS